jgi:hypothetical protein
VVTNVTGSINRFEHPVLGPFEAESWEWRSRAKIAIPFLDGREFLVSIVPPEDEAQPVAQQFDAIVHLVQAPPSYLDEFSAAMARAYLDEIRPEYLRIRKEIPDADIKPRELPDLKLPSDIWGRIKAAEYLWVNDDASVHVSFKTRFDAEHALNVRLVNRAIERVWME